MLFSAIFINPGVAAARPLLRHRSQRHYLVNFSDEVKNRYDFAHAIDLTNTASDKGIRPGESAVWTYEFNEDNFPLEPVRLFQVLYPAAVFGRSLRLNIPTEAIPRPNIPGRLSSRTSG